MSEIKKTVITLQVESMWMIDEDIMDKVAEVVSRIPLVKSVEAKMVRLHNDGVT